MQFSPLSIPTATSLCVCLNQWLCLSLTLYKSISYIFSLFPGGKDCKCNLLKHDDYVSMVVSTVGEFVGMNYFYISFAVSVCQVLLNAGLKTCKYAWKTIPRNKEKKFDKTLSIGTAVHQVCFNQHGFLSDHNS